MSAEEQIIIGDTVTFESESGAFLSVDCIGNIFWDFPLQKAKTPTDYYACVWRVCDKLSYADQALLQTQKTAASSDPEVTEVLKKQAEREAKRNESQLENPSGMIARYGNVVQFQHIASGKFLCSNEAPAPLHRESLKVNLSQGESAVFFQVLPKYKVRSIGSAILTNDVVLLGSQRCEGHFLHESFVDPFALEVPLGQIVEETSAEKAAAASNRSEESVRECNLSRNSAIGCGLKICLYERSSQVGDEEYLHMEQCIRLFDRESGGFLVGLSAEQDPLFMDLPENGDGPPDPAVEETKAPPFLDGFEVPWIRKLSDPDNDPNHPHEFSADAIWAIEFAPPNKQRMGGYVDWAVNEYRIKHVPTGRYLTVGTELVGQEGGQESTAAAAGGGGGAAAASTGGGDEQAALYLPVTLEVREPGNAKKRLQQTFSLEHVESKREHVPKEDCFVTLCYTTPKADGSGEVDVWYGNIASNRALLMSSVRHSYDAMLIINVEQKQSSAVRFCRQLLPMLTSYLEDFADPLRVTSMIARRTKKDRRINVATQTLIKAQQKQRIVDILTQIMCEVALGMHDVLRSRGGKGLLDEESITQFQERAQPNPLLQNCLRDYGVPEKLLWLAVAPINAGFSLKQVPKEPEPEVRASRAISRQGSKGSLAGGPAAAASSGRGGKGGQGNKKKAVDVAWVDPRFEEILLPHMLIWACLRQIADSNTTNTIHIAKMEIPYKTMNPKSGPGSPEAPYPAPVPGKIPIKAHNEEQPLIHTEAIHVILEQIPYPVGATGLLTTLVNDTKELLLEVVNEETIAYFRSMISDFGPQARFLEFYQAICSCQGDPVARNQNIVLKELVTGLENQKDNILVTLYTIPGVEYPPVPNSKPSSPANEDERYLGEEYVEGEKNKFSEKSPVGFLGHSTKGGFPRVFVAWQGSDKWTTQSENLFWSPKALKLTETVVNLPTPTELHHACNPRDKYEEHVSILRGQEKHISIEELCWVLNKEKFYHKVHTDKLPWSEDMEKEMSKEEKERLANHTMIGNYLQAQIELMAEMVYGRNYIVIQALERIFPYIMLVGIISSRNLPYRMRGSFVKLLNCLWLDRYPCEHNCGRQSLPDLVWVYSQLEDVDIHHRAAFPRFSLYEKNPLVNKQEPIYNISGAQKYKLLTGFVNSFITEFDCLVVDKIYDNACIRESMSLVSNLASFGFYPTAASMAKLIKFLLPMLDGRSDLLHDDDELRSYIIETVGEESCVHQVERYKANSKSTIVMNAKISMLEAVSLIINLRTHFRLMKLLNVMKHWVEERTLPDPASVPTDSKAIMDIRKKIFSHHDARTNALELDTLCRIPLNATLIDLFMYESDALLEVALRTLESVCIPVKSLLDVSEKVLLLRNPELPIFGDFGRFDWCVTQLKQEFESCEIWGQTSEYVPAKKERSEDRASYEMVWSILVDLNKFLDPSTLIQPKGREISGTPRDTMSIRQRLLFNLDVHSILLIPIRDWDLSAADMPKDMPQAKSGTNSLYAVAAACFVTLSRMIRDNPELRTHCKAYMDLLCSPEGIGTFSQVYDLLHEIYQGAEDQVDDTPARLFKVFGDKLRLEQRQMPNFPDRPMKKDQVCLSFFYNMLVPERKPGADEDSNAIIIPRNQDMVAEFFPWNDVGQHLRVRKSTEFTMFEIPAVNLDRLKEHIKAVSVLAETCRGNNDIGGYLAPKVIVWALVVERIKAISEALCEFVSVDSEREAVMPNSNPVFPDSPNALKMKELTRAMPIECLELLTVYINFMNWAYLDTRAVDALLIQHPTIGRVVSTLANFISHYGVYLLAVRTKRKLEDPNKPFPRSTSEQVLTAVKATDTSQILSLVGVEGVYNAIDRSILKFYYFLVSAAEKERIKIDPEQVAAMQEVCDSLYRHFTNISVEICFLCNLGGRDEIVEAFQNTPELDAKITSAAAALADIASSKNAAELELSYAVANSTQQTAPDKKSPREEIEEKANAAAAAEEAESSCSSSSNGEELKKKIFWYDSAPDAVPASIVRQFEDFVYDMKTSSAVRNLLERDESELLRVLMSASSITDPNNEEYQANMDPLLKQKLSGPVSIKRGMSQGGGVGNVKLLNRNASVRVHATVPEEQDILQKAAAGASFAVASASSAVATAAYTVASTLSPHGEEEGDGPSGEEIRTNRVSWDDIVVRMVAYVNHQLDDDLVEEKPTVCSIMRILLSFLRRGGSKEAPSAGLSMRQNQLLKLQVPAMVYRLLIFVHKGPTVPLALELGATLLSGGNLEVQNEFQRLSMTTDADGLFFLHMNKILLHCKDWAENNEYNPVRASAQRAKFRRMDPEAVKDFKEKEMNDARDDIRLCVLTLSFLRQLCEGHNPVMQDMLRDQSELNRFSYNLVQTVTSFVVQMTAHPENFRNMHVVQKELLVNLLDYLVEVCQGPSPENQAVVGSLELLAGCKTMLTAKADPKNADMVVCIKCKTMVLIAALLENVPRKSPLLRGVMVKVDKSSLDSAYSDLHFAIFRKEDEEAAEERKKRAEKGTSLLSYLLPAAATGSGDNSDSDSDAEDGMGDNDEDEKDILSVEIPEIQTAICNILTIRNKVVALEQELEQEAEEEEAGGGAGATADQSVDVSELPPCHDLLAPSLGHVEILWHGKIEEIVFLIPPEAKYLSETTKSAFLNNCDLSTCDSRVKDLMGSLDSFIDEMEVLSGFSGIFQFILRNYFALKHALFINSFLLNFNIIVTLARGSQILGDYYGSTASPYIMTAMGSIAFIGYGSLARYWIDQTAAFTYRGFVRDREEKEEKRLKVLKKLEEKKAAKEAREARENSAHKVHKSVEHGDQDALLKYRAVQKKYNAALEATSSASNAGADYRAKWSVKAFIPCFAFGGLFTLASFIHYEALKDTITWNEEKKMERYLYGGGVVMFPILVWCIRKNITVPSNSVEMGICVFLDTLFNGNVMHHLLLVCAIACALTGYVFLYCILMVDFVTMSLHAKNTLRSVVQPWQPLVNVAMVFLIVINIFGVLSFTRINGISIIPQDYANGGYDDDNQIVCTSAWTCLGNVFYGGLINGDIGSVLEQAQTPVATASQAPFTERFFFDVSFVIIVGLLLSNMVTGIIVDTFSSLREESQEIERLQTEETFVSGVTHDIIDKILSMNPDGNNAGVNFDQIQDEDQFMWNYVYYAVYLERKDPNDYDGMESYVSNCIKNDDFTWFPRKASLSIQRVMQSLDKSAGGGTDSTTVVIPGVADAE